jgi:cation diffusion facilitator family transporter
MRNNSPAILADAFENRADAISSVAVIAGIIAARVIHPILDPIAALIVCVIIFWNCQEQLREAAAGLMDRGLSEGRIEAIRDLAGAQLGVASVAFVRTRQTGVHYWVDLGIEIAPGLTVEEGDAIAAAVRSAVATTPQCHFVDVYVSPASTTALGLVAPSEVGVSR